jgi:nucleotide-binding universal stress UspA family protein
MDQTRHIQRIVVGVDFSDQSARAYEQAFLLAQQNEEAELHIVSVVDRVALEYMGLTNGPQPSLADSADRLRDELIGMAHGHMKTYRAAHPGSRELTIFVHVRVGRIGDEIAQLGAEVGADLLVVGTHGRTGMQRLLLGSVAERVVRFASCPVLVVRPKDPHAMVNVPPLEPACPRCLKTRQETDGRSWWCEPHRAAPRELQLYARSQRLDAARP